MMEQSVNVYVDLNSPHKEFPDPSEIANRYGVDEDNDSESDREDREEEERRQKIKQEKKDAEEARINNSSTIELVGKVKQLATKLTEKNKEIDRLCSLLEAMEPVPGGVDPEKFLKIYDEGSGDGVLVDYRDTKIVALAKKVRKVTQLLNKERATNTSKTQSVLELTAKVEKLTKELDLVSSPAARAAALRHARNDIKQNEAEADISEMRKEMQQLKKQNEELKQKNSKVTEENKRLNRILVKEVGENYQNTSDEGWRGRSQQILALKSKVYEVNLSVQYIWMDYCKLYEWYQFTG